MSDLITKEKLEIYARELCLECPDAPMEECLCGCMKKAIYNALAETLQEREERSKGCEHCNNKKLPLEGGAHDFRILGNAIFYYDATFGWEGTTIGRCPWCGRWLEGEQDD